MTIETKVHFSTGSAGQKQMREGTVPPEKAPPPVRIPRIARLMALAIHFDGLIRRGVVRDYADLARLGGVTRARITQIMNLLNLAPDIQERLLFLPGAAVGRDSVTEREMRAVCDVAEWREQREMWRGTALLEIIVNAQGFCKRSACRQTDSQSTEKGTRTEFATPYDPKIKSRNAVPGQPSAGKSHSSGPATAPTCQPAS